MSRSPKIVKTRLMPKKYCLNLFGIYFTRDKTWINKYVVNHERIHDAQQRELLYIPFYILYILEWLFRLLQYRNQPEAYMNISFEREAYAHGDNLSYLQHRRPYSFLRYLRLPKKK
ncbi:MAG: hypothetical protein K2L34_13600 [Muribaculaceae bacterium]|nr:hypothetical protein [Muribaculaceae bacterium]